MFCLATTDIFDYVHITLSYSLIVTELYTKFKRVLALAFSLCYSDYNNTDPHICQNTQVPAVACFVTLVAHFDGVCK